jgi:hypothetical protein
MPKDSVGPENTIPRQAAQGRVVRTPRGQLSWIDHQGRSFEPVQAIPLFPVSQPDGWISIVSASGEELALFESLEVLPSETADPVREELAFRQWVPRILRVVSVSGTSEPCEWVVETDRGRTQFVLTSEENIRRLSDHTVQILAGSGARFRVEDTRHLDPRSRRFIEWYV